MIASIYQDFRHALRQFRKNPGFATVAVVTLALAIGANTAIFSVVQVVLLAPLPYLRPDRLMMIWERNPSRGDQQFPISPGDFFNCSETEEFEASAPNEHTAIMPSR